MAFVRIEHPLFPNGVEVREELLREGNEDKLNEELISLGGQILPEDEEGGYMKDFIQGISSSIRGIADFAGADVTETEDAKNLELYQRMRSEGDWGAFGARMAGELLDPVTAPAAVLKVLKSGSLVKELLMRGAAAGSFSGFIQPVFEEYGDSRMFNTAAGGVLGAGIGAAFGSVAAKLGYKSADDMAKAMQDMDEKQLTDLESAVEREILALESPEAMNARKAAEAKAEQEAQVVDDAKARAEQLTQEAQLQQIRDQGDAAGAAIRAEEAAKAEAAAKQAEEQEVIRLAAEGQRNRIETQQYEARIEEAIARLEEDVATIPSRGVVKKFEAQVKNVTSDINKLSKKIDNLTKSRDAILKSKIAPKAQRARVNQLNQEIERITRDRDVMQSSLDKREGRMLNEINALKDKRTELNDYYNKGILPASVRDEVGDMPQPSVSRATEPTAVAKPVPAETPQLSMFPEGMIQAGAPVPVRPAQARQIENLSPSRSRIAVSPDSPRAQAAPEAPVSPSQPRSAQSSATPQGAVETVPEQGAVARTIDAAIGSISARIEKFAPSIMSALRNFERRVLEKQANYINPTDPFFKAVDQLSPAMRRALKGHLYNGRLDEAMRLMNPTMRKQFMAIRSDLKKVHAELKAAGIDVARIDDYFPRKVADVKGLRDKLNREHKDKFTKAINDATKKNGNKPLSPEQEEEVLNKVVRDVYRPKDPTRRGNTAARTLGELPDELLDFYHEPSMALTSYYRNMVDMTEKAKFFGRNMKVTDENTIDAVESIGNVIRDARIMRNLTPQQVDDLTRMLTARFVTGEQAPNAVLRWTRDTGYMGTIGNMVSAITNLGDLGTSGALHGFAETIAAAFGKNKYDVVKMGIDHSISHELMDNKATAKALQKVFTWSGFRFTDRLGKNTLMNAAMSKNEKLAKSEAGKAALRKRWGKYFGDETEALLVDLEKGNITENTKLLAFHELSNVQPITLSEMPQYYLEHPDGRIVYMLKSFTLKQLDLVRRHVIREAKQGNTFQAAKNMALLAGYLAAANTGTQVVKDWILGRDIDPDQLPEQAMWNVFSVFGVNKYIADRYLSQGDVMGAISNTLLPPVPVLEMARKGIKETGKMLEDEEYNYAKLTKELPVVGSLIYSWFGGGKENYNDRLAKAGEE